jgi:hypothetical protein
MSTQHDQPKTETPAAVGSSVLLAEYPEDWKEIATRIKCDANWKCERCKHTNDRETGHVLTVHHLDGNKHNCADWNLAALCQRCHLAIQGRVKMDQLFFEDILDVSEWFKPHLRGYLQAMQARSANIPAEARPASDVRLQTGALAQRCLQPDS